MKYLTVDIVLSVVYILVLALVTLGYLNIFLISISLFALLAVTMLCKFVAFDKTEEMGRKYSEKEKKKLEKNLRRDVIDHLIWRVDSMMLHVSRLKSKNFIYVLD